MPRDELGLPVGAGGYPIGKRRNQAREVAARNVEADRRAWRASVPRTTPALVAELAAAGVDLAALREALSR